MLRGGGGSTIGVVVSMTVKAYPQLQTTTVTFNFTVADTPGVDAFWSAVQAYIDNIEHFVDAGTYGYYDVGASAIEFGTDYAGDTDYYFRIQSFVAPNMTVTETQELLEPWFNVLNELNVSYHPWFNHADNLFVYYFSCSLHSILDMFRIRIRRSYDADFSFLELVTTRGSLLSLRNM